MLSADVLRPLADLLLTLATATMLVYMMRRIRSGRRLKSNKGRDFMMAGFALVVVASFADLILRLAVPESLLLGNPALLHGIVPGWLVWVVTRLSFSLLAIGLLLAFRQRLSDEKKFRASKREATDAYAVMVQSEARFRHLYETTSDSVYCFAFDPPLPISIPLDEQVTRSHDAILTECNAVFAKVLQRESPSDVVGWRLGQLHSTLDADAHLRFFQAVVESGYNLTDYEMLYTDPGGTERALRMSVTGIVHDGFLLRYWAVETNILDLRRTKAALLRRRTFHDLLTNISSRLIMAAPSQADDEVRASIQSVCEYIEADRTSVLWIDPESMAVEIAYGWSVADIPLLSNINLTEFPKGTEKVLRGESLCINDVAELPDDWREEGKRFSELGMKSFVAVPLMADGQVVGVSIYTHLNEKREFRDQDLADLRVFSDLLANYILRLRSSRQLDSALAGLKKATERLDAENVYLREEIELTLGFDAIIGRSAAMLNCLVQVERVAVTSAPVLILGETGTGKELIARAIHEHSDRSGRPLVKVNCAALPGNLIESELFGYEKGAFTGAEKAKRGRFDLADGSSIFLDEFGDIPLELQAKLLRVLQEGEFERLGGNRTIKVDVRIIAATNKNISDAVNAGEFRSDLLYRINAFPIEVPALRERGDDIRMLTEHFVQSYSKRYGKEITAISARMMEEISEYSWPGNIRELEGVVQRALISSTTSVLGLAATLTELSKGPDGSSSHPDDATNFDLEDAERRHIVSVLNETGWKIAGVVGAATKLGIPPSTLRSKMQKLSIQRPA